MQRLAFDVFSEDDRFDRIPTSQIFAFQSVCNDVRGGRAIQARRRAIQARRILRLGGGARQTEQHHQLDYRSKAFNPNRKALLSETGSTDRFNRSTYSHRSGLPEWSARFVPIKDALFNVS